MLLYKQKSRKPIASGRVSFIVLLLSNYAVMPPSAHANARPLFTISITSIHYLGYYVAQ